MDHVFHDSVIRPDGLPGIYGVVHYRNRAVGIVAIDALDRVLLVGQYRYTLDQYSWEIPAGGTDENEQPADTALRELKEETGFTAKNIELLVRAHLSNSVSDEEAFCYLVERSSIRRKLARGDRRTARSLGAACRGAENDIAGPNNRLADITRRAAARGATR